MTDRHQAERERSHLEAAREIVAKAHECNVPTPNPELEKRIATALAEAEARGRREERAATFEKAAEKAQTLVRQYEEERERVWGEAWSEKWRTAVRLRDCLTAEAKRALEGKE